jgi:hypothetical protein
MGLGISVSSTKAGRRAYDKAGFYLLGDITQDESEWGGDGEHVMAFFSKIIRK